MPFVNEKISEEDQARIDWVPYRIHPTRFRPFRPFKWTIDRGRDVFLLRIGDPALGPDPHPKIYGLNWKGTLIRFMAQIDIKRNPGSKSDLYWNIVLPIPDSLVAEAEEIKADLKEAIEAHGYFYGGPDEHRSIQITIR